MAETIGVAVIAFLIGLLLASSAIDKLRAAENAARVAKIQARIMGRDSWKA